MIGVTFAQKASLRRLLQDAGYDCRTVTYLHRRLGVGEEWIGRSVDEWLDSLELRQASTLISKLQTEAEE